ncbi:dihydrodipicolinate synthase family protein [Ewingella americana]|uniref:Dihydrodipicolinate synthase family protein n=1 Tax=Ewingella americana TaxID=41202 RepID=A0A502GVL0_9GAMM|nr:dihydrodipicolinate synthase family protein [Ewingella americana]TPG65013.1 dihydrodipicolinate synthase family protein [Ewingella americana]
MFKGLCAFPLTPVTTQGVDEKGFTKLLSRLTEARVDSIGVLGSTGSYAYLTREQRKRITLIAREQSAGIPLMVCVGAVSTEQVLQHAEDAQNAGAEALLLPAMSYQRLSDDEVFGLFETVTQNVSLPVCIYDNPGTTHFEYSDELYGRLSELHGVRSVKIPGVPNSPSTAAQRVKQIRSHLSSDVSIGISGDAFAGLGLNAGCDIWYSVCGGLFPITAKEITEAAAKNDKDGVTERVARLEPLWALFRKHGGSLRVIAAAAGIMGITEIDCLPRPLRPLHADDVTEIARVISQLGLD